MPRKLKIRISMSKKPVVMTHNGQGHGFSKKRIKIIKTMQNKTNPRKRKQVTQSHHCAIRLMLIRLMFIDISWSNTRF